MEGWGYGGVWGLWWWGCGGGGVTHGMYGTWGKAGGWGCGGVWWEWVNGNVKEKGGGGGRVATGVAKCVGGGEPTAVRSRWCQSVVSSGAL